MIEQMNAENRKTWFTKRSKALVWLKEQFPLAFSHAPTPLKVGIHQDIFDANPDGMPAKRWVRYALSYYVSSYAYLNSLKTDVDRFNLQGHPDGKVNEQEATRAKSELDKRKQKKRCPPELMGSK